MDHCLSLCEDKTHDHDETCADFNLSLVDTPWFVDKWPRLSHDYFSLGDELSSRRVEIVRNVATKRKRLNGSILDTSLVVSTRKRLTSITISKYPNIARRRMEVEKFNLPLLKRLAMLGMPDKDIAQVLDMKATKFSKYKNKYSSIRVTLKRGRVIPSSNVVESLYKKANGFSVPEEKIFYSSKYDKVRRVKTRRYYPPDTLAQIFWLKNHYPDLWRDKKEVENTGGVGAIQSVKFILVQPGVSGGKGEKVIDADFKILPGAGQEGREQQTGSSNTEGDVE